MSTTPSFNKVQLEALRHLDSSLVANAIEGFDVRLRNTGFTDSTIHCLFPDFPSAVGYAATARISTSEPPMEGHSYLDRTDWWNHILSIPEPRIIVVEDMGQQVGLGAFLGKVHTNIVAALGCAGLVTNGAVRDIQESRAMQFQVFAGNLSVSHAYAHIVDFGGPVTVGRMKVSPGDLVHGDLHGVQTIPLEIAGEILDAAKQIQEGKERIIKVCRSPDCTLEKIRAAIGL
jgi:4-hydroxy-4-methyl-2-oxoglutarate aldolase